MRPTRRVLLLAFSAGGLLAGGCLANLERAIDMVLSPGAIDNAFLLPNTALAGLAELLARLLAR